MNKRTVWTLVGFLLFITGFLSMVLYLFAGGIRFSFLAFIDTLGPVAAFVIRLLMIFGGLIIVYISKSDPSVE